MTISDDRLPTGTRVAFDGGTGRVLRLRLSGGPGPGASYILIDDRATGTAAVRPTVARRDLTPLPPLEPGDVVYVLHGARVYAPGRSLRLVLSKHLWDRLCIVVAVRESTATATVRIVGDPLQNVHTVGTAYLTPDALPEPGRWARGTRVVVTSPEQTHLGTAIRRVVEHRGAGEYRVASTENGAVPMTFAREHLTAVPPEVAGDWPVRAHQWGWHPAHGHVVVLRLTGYNSAVILPLDAACPREAVTVRAAEVFPVGGKEGRD